MFFESGDIMSTITAISTASGIGGIGIVRISGEETFDILNKIFIPKNKDKKIEGYKIKYGHIINPKTKKILDEVLVSFFIKPKSYTTEDMCEINTHGGPSVINQILGVCLENGAELAMPGEFTKRAFLNGRIDLVESEAIIDMINAKSRIEAQAATRHLEGKLSLKIKEIREKGISIMSDIEASIDYPEYDVEEVTEGKVLEAVEEIKDMLKQLEDSFETGKIIKEGIKTAIIGTPNAGKSSLLNAMLEEERAIVTEHEGTTRDTIEEFITVQGIPLKIIDTAGIRNTKNEVEKIGIEKSKKIAKEADLVIAIFDGSKNIKNEDREILELIKNKENIIILNKEDLGTKHEDWIKEEKLREGILHISAKNKTGIEQIYGEIVRKFNLEKIKTEDGITITNIRHINLIKRAKENVEKAKENILVKMPIDVIAIEIKEILENLGEITGEEVSESIINDIFSKFCLGK